jgi:tetratricopeptide (TPR) repeat protein
MNVGEARTTLTVLVHSHIGLAPLAQGKLEEAAAESRDAIRHHAAEPYAHYGLGIVLRKQGKYAESLAELRTAHELGTKIPGWDHPSAAWVREAETTIAIADRLPALIRDDDRPRDNAERLALARACDDRKLNAAAARLWGEAMAADPKLAEDLKAEYRHEAAVAAVQAGCGQGRDEPAPDEPARAKLRAQALEWLRADLASRARQFETDAPAARTAMAYWKGDPELAGVRDPVALARLPEPERTAWQAFWADADRLLDKAKEAKSPR